MESTNQLHKINNVTQELYTTSAQQISILIELTQLSLSNFTLLNENVVSTKPIL